jgi:hypothetical protein
MPFSRKSHILHLCFGLSILSLSLGFTLVFHTFHCSNFSMAFLNFQNLFTNFFPILLLHSKLHLPFQRMLSRLEYAFVWRETNTFIKKIRKWNIYILIANTWQSTKLACLGLKGSSINDVKDTPSSLHHHGL